MKRTLLRFVLRQSLTLFTISALFAAACKGSADSGAPGSFGRDAFYRSVDYAVENYIDPDGIDQSRCYVNAADMALRSLPYSLTLMTREFYEKRAQFIEADRIPPGRALQIEGQDQFVIFVPDYSGWKERRDRIQSQDEERYRRMSQSDRRAEFLRQRQQDEELRKFTEASWKRVDFSKNDFERVVAWIEKNLSSYSAAPAGMQAPEEEEGEAGAAGQERPSFGMNVVYFAAANGFVEAMDPHSAVIDQGSWDKMRTEAEDSSFEGIGALLRGGGREDVIVETPLPGSPALQAGLRAGDIIRKVDGQSIATLSLGAVVKRIRGPKQTMVTLEVNRATELKTLSIRITRDVIHQTAVSSRLLSAQNTDARLLGGRKIGYIKIASFLYAQNNTSRLIRNEYQKLIQEAGGRLDGLVLDLRGNPGGYLEEAVDVAGLFLPRGSVVVRVRDASGEVQEDKSSAQPVTPADLPIVTLINAGSASASEIVASALLDHKRSLILGERSFGKATVQGVHPLRGGAMLKLTTARYYAPNGYTVQVYGVLPDIELSDEADGSFPPRWREEDMWKHLPELESRPADGSRTGWIDRLKALANSAAAESYLRLHQADALKPDHMLIRALPYLVALGQSPAP
ncbi:MAG: S41 family peptidase [Leptospirales bacterium]|nr:S41 family peptidase [Leptospirales bacterium]